MTNPTISAKPTVTVGTQVDQLVPGQSKIITSVTPTKNIANDPAPIEDQYTLEDVDPIGRSEVMIYGKPGNGKGVLAATFPPPFRWIAADGKTSLKSLHWAMKTGRTSFTDPKMVRAYTPTEIAKGKYITTARAFNLMQDMIAHWFSPGEVDQWETLVLDSFTEINTWALDLGLGLNNQLPTQSKPLSRSDEINRKAMVRLITGEQDYKSAMGLIEGFLRNVRVDCARHNKNLVVLCHEWQDSIEKDDGTVIITAVQPLLIGQLRTRIVKDFDDVWFMEKLPGSNGPEITAYLQGTATAVGKSRWGTIVTKMKDPDYRKMIEEVKKFHATP